MNDFLSLDKLEQGKVELTQEAFDIRKCTKEVAEDVQAVKKKEQVLIPTREGEYQVTLDEKKLRYILINLLSNSLKYSPEGAQVTVSSLVSDLDVVISVHDTGSVSRRKSRSFFSTNFSAQKIQEMFAGFKVIVAENGREGLSMAANSKPDIFFATL